MGPAGLRGSAAGRSVQGRPVGARVAAARTSASVMYSHGGPSGAAKRLRRPAGADRLRIQSGSVSGRRGEWAVGGGRRGSYMRRARH